MKPLQNHVIVYDAECPMCALYTGAFTRYGLLSENGRMEYATLSDSDLAVYVDMQRARNEIALIDTEQGHVRYGLDSMLHILGHGLPLLRPLFAQAWFRAVFKPLYFFISYNRKVIAPSRHEDERSCVPDFNVPYRFLFVFLGLYIALYAAWCYSESLPTEWRWTAVGSIAALWWGHALWTLARYRLLALIPMGHLSTLFCIATLLLLPAYSMGGAVLWTLAGTAAALVVLYEYVRRSTLVRRQIAAVL